MNNHSRQCTKFGPLIKSAFFFTENATHFQYILVSSFKVNSIGEGPIRNGIDKLNLCTGVSNKYGNLVMTFQNCDINTFL